MTAETLHQLQAQLDDLEHTVRAKAETRNLPCAVRDAICDATAALVAAQRLLNEVRPT